MNVRVVGLTFFWLFTAVSAHASIVMNGSFETPDVSSNTYGTFAAIPGWTAGPGTYIEIQDHVAGSPYDGQQHVELDSNFNSSMVQTLNTVVGRLYELSFAYSPRPGVASTSNGIDVLWGGNLVLSVTANGIGLNDTNWGIYSLYLTATHPTTDLTFVATGTDDSYGGYIDSVAVESLPEPTGLAVWSLLGLTIATLTHRSRRKDANAIGGH